MMYSKWLFISLGGKKLHTHTHIHIYRYKIQVPKLVPFVYYVMKNEKLTTSVDCTDQRRRYVQKLKTKYKSNRY